MKNEILIAIGNLLGTLVISVCAIGIVAIIFTVTWNNTMPELWPNAPIFTAWLTAKCFLLLLGVGVVLGACRRLIML